MTTKTKSKYPKPGIVHPGIGVSIILYRYTFDEQAEILMLKRVGPHGAGTWSFPGGHLEWGEKAQDGVLRELREEVGIKLAKHRIHNGFYVEDVHKKEHKHMITLYFYAQLPEGRKPKIMEPTKHSELRWVPWLGDWPKPLFKPVVTWLNSKMDNLHL